MNTPSPPRLAGWLLRCIVPTEERESIMGDLAEEFSFRTQSSAAWWYWGQTLRSIPIIAWQSVRRGLSIQTFLVALGAYFAAGLVEFAADAALAKIVNPKSFWEPVLGLITGLTTMTAGGYAAARLRQGAEKLMSGLILLAVTILFAAQVGEAPVWYGLAFLVAGPVASLAGGALALKRKT